MTVCQSIEAAFADVPYPGDDSITRCTWKDCPECEDIATHFRGATWHGHTVAELQQYQSALSFFTPSALQYFLPAYMVVSLGAWEEADMIPFSILQKCLPPESKTDVALQQHWRDRISVFNRQQREAIIAYLNEWAKSNSPLFNEDDLASAIKILRSDMPDTRRSKERLA